MQALALLVLLLAHQSVARMFDHTITVKREVARRKNQQGRWVRTPPPPAAACLPGRFPSTLQAGLYTVCLVGSGCMLPCRHAPLHAVRRRNKSTLSSLPPLPPQTPKEVDSEQVGRAAFDPMYGLDDDLDPEVGFLMHLCMQIDSRAHQA